ncbi:MAG: hypothetical protein Q8O58_03475 [Gallionella sp.]|nr:hypothetical protein [Gallionella sp.]
MPEKIQRVFFSSERPATSHCFDFAIRSLRAAELQVNRIWNRPVVGGDPIIVKAAFEDILIDVHFYFISLRNIYRFLKKVIADPAFEQLRPELDRLNEKWFRHYGKGREAFEHIDQRLPGEKHEMNIVEIEEAGARRKINYGLRLREGLFLHSDLEWDITSGTFEAISHDVQALLQQIVGSCKPIKF